MQLGLIGYPISHSKSPEIFKRFFTNLQSDTANPKTLFIQWDYQLLPLESINDLINLLLKNNQILGLNVTIPHKISIIPFIEFLSVEAANIQSVNTVCVIPKKLNTAFELSLKKLNINCLSNPSFNEEITKYPSNKVEQNTKDSQPPHTFKSHAHENFFENFSLWGFNSDYYGIKASIQTLCPSKPISAIVLGDGGSAKTVKYVLNELNIPFQTYNRSTKNPQTLHWDKLHQIEPDTLFINTTPIGMWPHISEFPPIPFHLVKPNCKFLDLIYNPEITLAMQEFIKRSCIAMNGKLMLQQQAEKSWEIFQLAGEVVSIPPQ